MTAFNGERYIAAALDSLIGQSMAEWQCVVVDDGSTDDTAALVEKIMVQEPRVRLIRQQRGGVSAARNAGIAALDPAVGYIGLLDCDDCYTPDALQRLVDVLDARADAVGVFGLAEYMDADGGPVRPGAHPEIQRERRAVRGWGLVSIEVGADSTFADLAVTGAIWPSAVGLHRRSAIVDAGGFDPSFRRQGDWELYVRMSRLGPFPMIEETVAWYRRHDRNLTGNYVESTYHQHRVREKAYSAPENTGAQRRIVARGARRLYLAAMRQLTHRTLADLRRGRFPTVAKGFAGLAVLAVDVLRPRPAPPSRRRVRLTQHEQNDVNGRV